MAEAAASSRSIVVRVDDKRYAFEGRFVSQVVPVGRLTPIPRTSDELQGLFTYRGLILPLFDLRPLLNMPEAQKADDLAVLVEKAGEPFALAVSEVLDYATLDTTTTGSDLPYGKAELSHQSQVATVLDLEALLAALERQLVVA